MKTNMLKGVALALGFVAVPALAQNILGNDVILTDISPTVAFDDSDSVGYNWVVRGDDVQFYIYDDLLDVPVFRADPVLKSTATGYYATATQSSSTAIGYNTGASASNAVAIGYNTFASGASSIAAGPASQASGTSSTALGSGAYASALRSTAIGYRARADQDQTIVIGSIPGVHSADSYANVGMGTTNPTQAVDVERSSAAARFQLTSFTNTATEAPQYIQRRARGTSSAPFAVQDNDNLGLFSFRGHNGNNMGGSRATITAQAAGNFTNSSTPTRLIFAVTPTGATAPEQVLVIENGQVKVNGQSLNVPDYVFEDDYPLMPLAELRAFIAMNGHLPGIPSADEVNANGHDLAGSDMANLQKIEELTLYTLQLERRLSEQQDELQTLRHEVLGLQQLDERFEQLQARLEDLAPSGN